MVQFRYEATFECDPRISLPEIALVRVGEGLPAGVVPVQTSMLERVYTPAERAALALANLLDDDQPGEPPIDQEQREAWLWEFLHYVWPVATERAQRPDHESDATTSGRLVRACRGAGVTIPKEMP